LSLISTIAAAWLLGLLTQWLRLSPIVGLPSGDRTNITGLDGAAFLPVMDVDIDIPLNPDLNEVFPGWFDRPQGNSRWRAMTPAIASARRNGMPRAKECRTRSR
jgi:hypothetical protein